jgi:hypothetical protein
VKAAIFAIVALTFALAITGVVAWAVQRAFAAGLATMSITVPWELLTGLAIGCLGLAIGAALIPAAIILRRTRPADIVGE